MSYEVKFRIEENTFEMNLEKYSSLDRVIHGFWIQLDTENNTVSRPRHRTAVSRPSIDYPSPTHYEYFIMPHQIIYIKKLKD